jgi:hypothetical protein
MLRPLDSQQRPEKQSHHDRPQAIERRPQRPIHLPKHLDQPMPDQQRHGQEHPGTRQDFRTGKQRHGAHNGKGVRQVRQRRRKQGPLSSQSQALHDAPDRGLADSQPLGHPAVGLSRTKPAANEGLLALVQCAMTTGALLGDQVIDAVLAVLLFPAGLRRDIVAERPADLLLRGQL